MKRQINFLSAKDLLSILGVLIALAFICPTLSFGQAPNCTPTPCITCTVTPCLIDKGIVNKLCLENLKNGKSTSIKPDMSCGKINDFLSKGINMEKMSKEIKKYPFGELTTAEKDALCKQPGLTPPSYSTSLCPERYCNEIKMLVESNARFIFRAAGDWLESGEQRPGTVSFNAMKQLVCDINAAYDCKGMPRPIIQGAVYEYVDESLDSTKACIPIPLYVIEAFLPESSKYKAGDCFNTKNIRRTFNEKASSLFNTSPDIMKPEGRMWLFYLATQQIDMGYTSIHMGDVGVWGKNDEPNFEETSKLMDKIRDYAKTHNEAKAVWLTAETPINKPLLDSKTGKMIFDFYSVALRTKEVGEPDDSEDCKADNSSGNDYFGTACEGQKNAYASICRLLSRIPKGAKISPTGCPYAQAPSSVYWDFGPGFDPKNPDHTILGDANPKTIDYTDKTWGWDDANWWNQLSDDCKAIVLGKLYCDIKDAKIGAFLQVPGLEPFNTSLNPLGLTTPLRTETYYIDSTYIVKEKSDHGWSYETYTVKIKKTRNVYWESGIAWIYDKPNVTGVMNMLWGSKPNSAEMHIVSRNITPKVVKGLKTCNGQKIDPNLQGNCYFVKTSNAYEFSVPVPKCVKNENKKWLIDGINVAEPILVADGQKHSISFSALINGKIETFTLKDFQTDTPDCQIECEDGIPKVRNNNNISIFPNPAAEERIIINIQEGTISEISISDISGKLISQNKYEKRESPEGITVDISALDGGAYIIRVQTDDGSVEIEKLIIER